MKYVIAERNGRVLQVWPTDDNPEDEETNPDHWLDIQLYDDLYDQYASIRIKVSEIYTFVDWLRKWAYDARSGVPA